MFENEFKAEILIIGFENKFKTKLFTRGILSEIYILIKT